MKTDKLLIIVLLFFLNPQIGVGQIESVDEEFEYNSTKLKTVRFTAPDVADWFTMKHDDQVTILPMPQWNETAPGPVGYVSGATPRILATFTNCPTDIWIKGSTTLELEQGVIEELIFPPTLLTSSGGEVTYGAQNAMISNPPGPDIPYVFTSETVRYIEQFIIVWKMCETNSTDESQWVEVGSSMNPLYLTYKEPVSSSPYHTIIHLGCTNANGITGPETSAGPSIVDAMFSPFLNPTFNVRRVSDNAKVSYYIDSDVNGTCKTLEALLSSPISSEGWIDGRCGAISELFYRMIKDQGLSGGADVGITHLGTLTQQGAVNLTTQSINDLSADAINQFGDSNVYFVMGTNVYHFLVKNWDGYAEGGFLLLEGMDYETAKSSPGEEGIKGQGDVDDPRSIFVNHAYTTYNNKIYDPSYGIIQQDSNVSNYEDSNLETVSGAIVFRNDSTTGLPVFYFWVETINNVGVPDFQTY